MGLKALGKSHEKYGVKAEYYPIVQEALLETIEEEMGELYNDKLGQAWKQALEYITAEMSNWKKQEQLELVF